MWRPWMIVSLHCCFAAHVIAAALEYGDTPCSGLVARDHRPHGPPGPLSWPYPATLTQSSLSTTTTTTTTTSSTTSTPSISAGKPGFCYGVNLGGWLILERWMTPSVFTGAFAAAPDQWTFDQIPGAQDRLQQHWSTYITEDTIKALAATGINCLRIPIGFWAYNTYDTPYHKSQQDDYLSKAMQWARNAQMRVLIDIHGSPGSQNGQAHSGRQGPVEWQLNKCSRDSNLQRTIDVLTTVAKKYGGQDYNGVVMGLQLTNEPQTSGGNDLGTTQAWTKLAYDAVSAVVTNPDFQIIMHDAWVGAGKWQATASATGSRFALDMHMYQLYTDVDNALTQDGHIAKACQWATSLGAGKQAMTLYVGEWSSNTNICVEADGSTTAGTSCTAAGCQCQSSTSMDRWNANMVTAVRRYVEAQLDVFERSTNGYFFWSVNGPGGWGFLNGIQRGTIPNPVTARTMGKVCGG